MCKEVQGLRSLGSGRIMHTGCHGNEKGHGNEELMGKSG